MRIDSKNKHIIKDDDEVDSMNTLWYDKPSKLSKKEEAWEYTIDQMVEKLKSYKKREITEVHLVGGVHPKMGLHYFIELIQKIKKIRPKIHIKAFTAVELEYMCRKAKVSYKEGLMMLKDSGQDSLPGGGAEIFAVRFLREPLNVQCLLTLSYSILEDISPTKILTNGSPGFCLGTNLYSSISVCGQSPLNCRIGLLLFSQRQPCLPF